MFDAHVDVRTERRAGLRGPKPVVEREDVRRVARCRRRERRVVLRRVLDANPEVVDSLAPRAGEVVVREGRDDRLRVREERVARD